MECVRKRSRQRRIARARGLEQEDTHRQDERVPLLIIFNHKYLPIRALVFHLLARAVAYAVGAGGHGVRWVTGNGVERSYDSGSDPSDVDRSRV